MFKPTECTDIGGGILLFSGIFQSVRINAVRVFILLVFFFFYSLCFVLLFYFTGLFFIEFYYL